MYPLAFGKMLQFGTQGGAKRAVWTVVITHTHTHASIFFSANLCAKSLTASESLSSKIIG